MYTTTPPWDIGRPQSVFVELAASGLVLGRVLDVGCGTGEHALMAAAMGLDAWGVDMASAAIASARQKASENSLIANFVIGSALELSTLNEQFDTVLDSGLFHIFEDGDRRRFAASLHGAMNPGGHYYMLAFSDKQPGDWGPRRVSEKEIRGTFGDGWQVATISPSRMALTVSSDGALAWLADIIRR